jgi:hypothetical protein
MDVTTADFRRHFAELSDEALLAIDRQDLVDAARSCLDEELSSRGLTSEPADPVLEQPESIPAELVPIAKFTSHDEAIYFQVLLRNEGIPARLTSAHAIELRHLWNSALGGIQLLVPATLAEEAGAILDAGVSEDELAAQAEAAAEAESGPASDTHPDD